MGGVNLQMVRNGVEIRTANPNPVPDLRRQLVPPPVGRADGEREEGHGGIGGEEKRGVDGEEQGGFGGEEGADECSCKGAEQRCERCGEGADEEAGRPVKRRKA